MDVTDISGIGPAKAETLAEEGFDSVEAIATAEPDTLAEVDGVGSDRALEFIVGAENLLDEEEASEDESEGEAFDLTPAEVSDEVDTESEEAEDAPADDESDSSEEDVESPSEEEEVVEEEESGPESYPVEIPFENKKQFDVFHASVMRHHERHYTGNQSVSEAMEKILSGLDSFEQATYDLTEEELNALHAGLAQQRTAYQGDNLIRHMDELNVVLDCVNEQRREYLF